MTRPSDLRGWWLVVLLGGLTACQGQTERRENFDAAALPAAWQVTGAVSIDTARGHTGGGSLQVAPGGRAAWKLRDTNGSGRVSFWVYEDAATREKDKERGAGPLYGITCADGRVLLAGTVYAPYLAGNTTYSLAEYRPAANEQPYFGVTYLGRQRTAGWHHWVFDFDPAKGLSISHNGQDLKGRFNWIKSEVRGFTGLLVLGDQQQDRPQSTWIDDLEVTLSDAPLGDPLAQLLPASDPPAEGEVPRLRPSVAAEHPRLLFGPEDLPALREFVKTPRGKLFFDRLSQYLGACNPPTGTAFLTDATDGQRQGLWRMPTVALHYLLTGDQASLDKAVGFLKVLLGLKHWELDELDSGMSSANLMIGAALCYDWLHDALDPAFRERFRVKLWEHARRQYYLGHLGRWGEPSSHYWQGDPQNNHRWHRNAGLALAVLTTCSGAPEQQWLLQQLDREMEYVVDWLPSDGTSHESPGYMIFGAAHLCLGVQAVDRCLGTDYLHRPFFAHLGEFMQQTLTPGLAQRLHYGDQGGPGVEAFNYDVFELLTIGQHQRGDLLDLADSRLTTQGVGEHIAWLGLLWYPRSLAPRPGTAPLQAFFADLGLQFVRDQWTAGGRGAMFKCGPFGGYLLNRFRAERKMQYINVAHDDPDANSFLLFAGDQFIAESDRYSSKKKSANHNTVLVNGVGQTVQGRDEGGVWSQPGGDMSQMAVVTARAVQGANLGIEGEAAGSYAANPRGVKRPAIERYRRSFLWLPGRYVLVLDDLRAPSEVTWDWLLQGGQVSAGAAQRFTLHQGPASCPLQVAATLPLTASVVDSPADNKNKLLGWKQLRLRAAAPALRLATVCDLWGRGGLTVSLTADTADHALVNITGTGLSDRWDWTAATSRQAPSAIIGRNQAGAELLRLDQPEAETAKLLQQIASVPRG
ncbi:MAG: heparinase II/III family protein [Fimbriimonadaceae bacterium]|nr:heparinase II/III family protein [Fimbriimonadaceae bacterium]